MNTVAFFTPVTDSITKSSEDFSLLRSCEGYFSPFSNKKATIITLDERRSEENSKKKSFVLYQKKDKEPTWLLALKVASYFTLVIPTIALLGKIIYRFSNDFISVFNSQENKSLYPEIPNEIKVLLPLPLAHALEKSKKPLAELAIIISEVAFKLFPVENTVRVDDFLNLPNFSAVRGDFSDEFRQLTLETDEMRSKVGVFLISNGLSEVLKGSIPQSSIQNIQGSLMQFFSSQGLHFSQLPNQWLPAATGGTWGA